MAAIATSNAPAAIGPYVQGVDLGSMVITSGQLPLDPETKAIPEDVAEQTNQSLNNALAILEEAGLTAANIVKTTVFVKDLNQFTIINAAYDAFFTKHNAPFPARSCVEVARLPMDAKVEIEVMAVK
ncbi:Rid family detoxifying hydrolase [Vibrio sp. HN007]|uniref:Rid family detoxifying hydrolase n=1 Tax=Vibrio iocasae TaxID=3098914 RepID=UPI0035D50800